jgi:hypothetical protein
VNVTEFLAEIRTILDDPVDAVNNPQNKFTDAAIISYLSRHCQGLCRTQFQRDQGFHNFMLILKLAEAKNPIRNVFQWALPPWVVGISRVRLKLGSDDPVIEPTFSPHLWTSPLTLSDPLERKPKNSDLGWKWDGNRGFQLWGYSFAQTIALEVCKLPARLLTGTVDQLRVELDRAYLPAALTLGQEDRVEGAYINAELQVTGSVTISKIGQVRRVVYSNANVDSGGGTRKSDLYLESTLPAALEVGDTIETVIPYGEEHARLLLLKTAWSCFEQLANIPAQKAIAADLADEMAKFLDYVTPRDMAQADSWHRPAFYQRTHDHDRSTARSNFT